MDEGAGPQGRRWWLALVGLVVLGLLGGYGYLRSGQPVPPKIEITPTSYDFGIIPYTKVETDFQVRNAGGSTLEITSVSTSCGCTTAAIESKTILPGESTRLHVTFDPRLMGEEGEIFRIVYIKSNDPKHPEVEIELRGKVVKPESEAP